MTYGLYEYTSDAGTVYAVSVPVDVATALSMVAATTQPYLDQTIAPRFANFRDSSGNIRQAVVQTKTVFSTIIGTTIVISGTNFIGSSSKGESIGALQPNLIQPPQALMGPPGPAGAAGSISTQQVALASDTTVNSGTSTTLGQLTLAPGNYLLLAQATGHTNSSPAGDFVILLQDSTGGGNLGGVHGFVQQSQYTSLFAACLLTLTASHTISMILIANSGNIDFYTNQGAGGTNPHRFIALKIG